MSRSTRDALEEGLILARAEAGAGVDTFAAHVLDRLDAGEARYGNHWTTLGSEQLVSRLLDEAADVGGWGVLALQALRRDEHLRDSPRNRTDIRLRMSMVLAALAHCAIETARAELVASSRMSR